MSSRSSASQHATPTQATYKVVVKTGSADSAGTSSRAYITLQGSKGKLRRRRLARNGGEAVTFVPGKATSFRVRGREVGDLRHVTSEWGKAVRVEEEGEGSGRRHTRHQ